MQKMLLLLLSRMQRHLMTMLQQQRQQ
jgi:hypothetical protein